MNKKDKGETPPKTEIISENIPKEIKDLKYWGLWSWVWKKDQYTKIPVNEFGGAIDAKEYNLSFKKALKLHKKDERFDGIGFYFSPDHDILGVDFDDCMENGEFTDKKVEKLVKKLGSYWEESPSGNGAHVMGKGASLLNGVDRKFIYAGTRYFTFTGKGQGDLKNIGKKVNKLFKVEKKIQQVTTGTKESKIGIGELYNIVMNIRPDLSEPDWFLVCKAIHYKTGGSEQGLKLFIDWSAGQFCKPKQKYKEFNEPDCIAKWNRCREDVENPVGLPTLREVESRYPVTTKKKETPKATFGKKIKLRQYNSRKLTLKHLPKNVRAAAKETARFNKVDIDPVITTMLIVGSAAINKKVNIIEREGLEHHCSMGVLMALRSGGRKSAIDRPLMKPFTQYEQEKMAEWQKDSVKNEQIVKALTKKMKMVEAMYNDEGETDENGVPIVDETQIAITTALQKKINQHNTARPKFIESDATEERLSDSLNKNNETLFIQSDDARNTVKNILGRYDNGGSENIYITGLTGDTYRRSRIKDDVEIVLNRPCINMSLKVQLDLAREMVTKGAVRESGLMARIFFKVVEGNVANQFREGENEADLQLSEMAGYYNAINTILNYEGKCVNVILSDEAAESRRVFANHYADMIDEGGEWSTFKDISNKVVTLSVKMGTVIALFRQPSLLEIANGGFGKRHFILEKKDYELGRDIVTILMDQTLEVIKNMEDNDNIEGALKLLEKLERDLSLWKKNESEKDYWTMSDMKIKFNDRNSVERWVSCLLENGMLLQEGNRFFPNWGF